MISGRRAGTRNGHSTCYETAFPDYRIVYGDRPLGRGRRRAIHHRSGSPTPRAASADSCSWLSSATVATVVPFRGAESGSQCAL